MPESAGLVQKNQANMTSGKHIHNYSTFDKSLSYRKYNTLRFGEYAPSFEMEGVERDEISLNSIDRIDSLSLKAPFKGAIRKIKESFKVPFMAILPMNWDKIYTQPSNGTDISRDANCVLSGFIDNAKSLFSALIAKLGQLSHNTASNQTNFYTALFRFMVLFEYIYSKGSLLNVCGYKFTSGNWLYDEYDAQTALHNYHDYDWWFDQICEKAFSEIATIIVSEPVGGSSVSHVFYGPSSVNGSVFKQKSYESFRDLLELFRENPLSWVTGITYETNYQTQDSELSNLVGSGKLIDTTMTNIINPSVSVTEDTTTMGDFTTLSSSNLNLSRLLAYQLVCAHFYSNSSIDFLYTAELYRQYLFTLYRLCNSSLLNSNQVISWNGQNIPVDYLSGKLLTIFLGLSNGNVRNNLISSIDSTSASTNVYPLAVYSQIFGYRRSLRYGDYFVGSRPRPLAPINTDVAVSSGSVSVIDITRNIQAQRFANSVMRSRQKIEEYVKSLFGKAPAPDFHNPFFLTRQEELIFGDEVQNTAMNTDPTLPQSRTSNFASNAGRYTFTFHNDDMHPCIYLQIISFDMKIAYSKSVDRQFLHADRYDMFNPDFQYIGDQPIYGVELGHTVGNGTPAIFAYTTRDMEYKQRFDVVSGGFASDQLPGWVFTDETLTNHGYSMISPDFIRSRNTDLDQFYLALSGYSLGTYFHFTCITDNNVHAKRAMAVDPQILA